MGVEENYLSNQEASWYKQNQLLATTWEERASVSHSQPQSATVTLLCSINMCT